MGKTTDTQKNEKGLVISFERAIAINNAIMENVDMYIRRMRTTLSEDMLKKGNESPTNLQTTEVAVAKGNEVKVNFKFRPLKVKATLAQTNNAENIIPVIEVFYNELNFDKYLEKNAQAIAYNILNGVWLWRNRKIALDGKITVEVVDANENVLETIEMDNILDIPIIDFDEDFNIKYKDEELKNKVMKLAEHLLKGFKDEERFYLNITATIKTFEGENVYPSELFLDSQELMEKIVKERYNENINLKLNNSKIRLFFKYEDSPAITAEKIWNAIRTYDIWYDEYPLLKEPISIEIDGANLKYQRFPRKRTFKDILKDLVEKKPLSEKDKMYFVACLIRGGVPVEKKEK